jgi:antitoxin CptB
MMLEESADAGADPGRNRIGWQCRRGMRELDVLLGNFLAQRYSDLDDAGRRTFELLLEYPDAVLLELLMGRMTPADTDMAKIVTQIRNATAA